MAKQESKHAMAQVVSGGLHRLSQGSLCIHRRLSLDHFIFEEADFVKRLKQQGARQGQKFTVLHRHPFHASGRKGAEFGFWSWVRTAVRFWLSRGKLVRDKAFAKKWYTSER